MSLTHLPVQLTSFIGREGELADVTRLLSSSHLVTITGPGGCGKTRLAIQVAESVRDSFKGGVGLVDLAPLHEPTLVPQVAAQALGLQFAPGQSHMEIILSFVHSKVLLLILDNCEHLAEACAALAQELLTQAPELRILATSREPLSITGEALYPIAGLACPMGLTEKRENPQDLMHYAAVRLFVERVQAVSPGFNLIPENAEPIIEICRRLDGQPLALELASARALVLAVHEIAARLNDRFALLISTQSRGSAPRHNTLRAAIDWSYDLLLPDEQALLRHMAVFEAGCSFEILEAICTAETPPGEPILELISSLVMKSLVIAETSDRSQARYHLLETIREYLLEKLDQAGETVVWRDRHLDLFLARVEEAAPNLTGAYQQLWLNWLEEEHDNLRAALAWTLESGQIEPGLRIVIALGPFWEIRGYMRECQTWYQRLLARMDDTISLDIRAKALVNAAYIAMAEGNLQASAAYGNEAVQAAEAGGDDALLSLALNFLGARAQAAGDRQAAFTVFERAIPIYRESGPPYHLRMALYLSGENAVELGKYELARERLTESLDLCQIEGDSYHIANIYNALGGLARLEQDYIGAASAYENGAALLREIGALDNLALILGNLGFTNLFLGTDEQAKACFDECMSIHRAQQNRYGQVECLIGFGAAAVKRGQTTGGVHLLAAAAYLSGQPSASHWKANELEFKRYNDLARSRLTESEYLEAQAAGRRLSLEQAVDYAQNLQLRSDSVPAPNGTPDGLTDREREVARLIGQGKTNTEIAAELVLSRRTVETHASHILSKLGFSSRAQIVRWALEHGLVEGSAG